MEEKTKAAILNKLESRGFKPYMRLIASIVIFCFAWTQISPAIAQDGHGAYAIRSAQEETPYVNQKDAPQSDYTPLRQRFEMIQMQQTRQVEEQRQNIIRTQNIEIESYKTFNRVLNNIEHAYFQMQQTGANFQRMMEYNRRVANENLSAVTPLHYFRKNGVYTEYVNGLPYRSERMTPNGQNAIVFEETFYTYNASRLLERSVARHYQSRGGALMSQTTTSLVHEAGSKWYAVNTGSFRTSVYDLIKSSSQVTIDYSAKDDNGQYIKTYHDINYINDFSSRTAREWNEVIRSSEASGSATYIHNYAASYDDSGNLVGVTKQYKSETRDQNTQELVIKQEWAEYWSGMSYTGDGALLSEYDVKTVSEDGTTYTHRKNEWDLKTGQLTGYSEKYTDQFGVVTEIRSSNHRYSSEGLIGYDKLAYTYAMDEQTGELILTKRTETHRTGATYKNGKLASYVENSVDELGMRIQRDWRDMVYEDGRLVGYNLEVHTAGGIPEERLSKDEIIKYEAVYDKYGRKQNETIVTRTLTGDKNEGEPQIETIVRQDIGYTSYYLNGRVKDYTVKTANSLEPGNITTEAYSNIAYYKGEIASYTLTRTGTAEPDKTQVSKVANTIDAYGRVSKVVEEAIIKGPGLELQRTTITQVTAWDDKFRKTGYKETITSSDAPGKTTEKQHAVIYDAVGQIKQETVVTRVAGKDQTGNSYEVVETVTSDYKRDSAGRLKSWSAKTQDQSGNVKIEENTAGIAQGINAFGEVDFTTGSGYNERALIIRYASRVREYTREGELKAEYEQWVNIKYDDCGRISEKVTGQVKEGKVSWAVAKTISIDGLGNLRESSDVIYYDDGSIERSNSKFSYDTLGRIYRINISWDGTQGKGWSEEIFEYDKTGVLYAKTIKESNPKTPAIEGTTYQEYRAVYQYDSSGQLVREEAKGKANTPYGSNMVFTSLTTYNYVGGYLVESHLARSDTGNKKNITTRVDRYMDYNNGRPASARIEYFSSAEGKNTTLLEYAYNERGDTINTLQTQTWPARKQTATTQTSIEYDEDTHLVSKIIQNKKTADTSGNYSAVDYIYEILSRTAQLKADAYRQSYLTYGKIGNYLLNPGKYRIVDTFQVLERDLAGRPATTVIDRVDESKAEGHGRNSQIIRTQEYNDLGLVAQEREVETTSAFGREIIRDSRTSNIKYIYVTGVGYLRYAWSSLVTTTDAADSKKVNTEKSNRLSTSYYPAGHIWQGMAASWTEQSYDTAKGKWDSAKTTSGAQYNLLGQVLSAVSGKNTLNYYYKPDGKINYITYSGEGKGTITYSYNNYGELTRTTDKGSAKFRKKTTKTELTEEGKRRVEKVKARTDLTQQEKDEDIRDIKADYSETVTTEVKGTSSWTSVTDFNYLSQGSQNKSLSHSSSKIEWVKQDNVTYYYHYKGGRIDYIDYKIDAKREDGYKIESGAGRITYNYEGGKLIGKTDVGSVDLKANNGVHGKSKWNTAYDYKGNDKFEKNEDKSESKTKWNESFGRKLVRIAVDSALQMASNALANSGLPYGLGYALAGCVNAVKAWFDAYMATGKSSMGDKDFRDAYWKSLVASTIKTFLSDYYNDGGTSSWATDYVVNVAGGIAADYAAEGVADYGREHGWNDSEITIYSSLAGMAASYAVNMSWKLFGSSEINWGREGYSAAGNIVSVAYSSVLSIYQQDLLEEKKEKLDKKYGKDEDISTKMREKKQREYKEYANEIGYYFVVAQSVESVVINIAVQMWLITTGQVKSLGDGLYSDSAGRIYDGEGNLVMRKALASETELSVDQAKKYAEFLGGKDLMAQLSAIAAKLGITSIDESNCSITYVGPGKFRVEFRSQAQGPKKGLQQKTLTAFVAIDMEDGQVHTTQGPVIVESSYENAELTQKERQFLAKIKDEQFVGLKLDEKGKMISAIFDIADITKLENMDFDKDSKGSLEAIKKILDDPRELKNIRVEIILAPLAVNKPALLALSGKIEVNDLSDKGIAGKLREVAAGYRLKEIYVKTDAAGNMIFTAQSGGAGLVMQRQVNEKTGAVTWTAPSQAKWRWQKDEMVVFDDSGKEIDRRIMTEDVELIKKADAGQYKPLLERNNYNNITSAVISTRTGKIVEIDIKPDKLAPIKAQDIKGDIRININVMDDTILFKTDNFAVPLPKQALGIGAPVTRPDFSQPVNQGIIAPAAGQLNRPVVQPLKPDAIQMYNNIERFAPQTPVTRP